MKLKKLVSLLMVAGLAAGLFAGCGGSNSEEDVVGSSDEAEYSDEDITEIELYAMTLYGTDGLAEVEDAINEISEAEIGVHVNLNYLDMSAYAEQTSLMFSSGDEIDLMMTTPIQSAGFSSLVSQNQLQDLSELLPEYAPETYEMMKDYLEGTTVNGKLMSVTTYRTLNSNCYALMRADILDDLGLREKAENLSTWSEYEEILKAVYDSGYDGGKVSTCLANNDSDGTVITVEYAMVGADNWEDNYGYDTLGDTYKIIAIDEDSDTVYDYFESEEYYNALKLMSSWYEKGYIYKDAATSDEGGDTFLSNDVTFSTVVNSEIGVEANRLTTTGKEIVAAQILSEPLSTGSVTKWTWAVPVTAKEPQAAVEFLNLMYTNAEIENLFVWGIEGRDYELNDEGEAVKLDTVQYQSNDFLYGNQFLAYPAKGQGGDFREVAMESLKSATISKYYGCTVDTSEISNQLTAVYNVIQQYKPNYESGSVAVPDTYEEYYNGEFCTALRAAGVDEVVAEYQSQMDAWLAEQ